MKARPTFSMQEVVNAVYAAFPSKKDAIVMCQQIAYTANKHDDKPVKFISDGCIAEGDGITLNDIYIGMSAVNALDIYILNVILWLDTNRAEK